MKIWLDGQLVDESQAKISVLDHGLLYGDGVFEGIRVYDGQIFKCAQHVERLFESADQLRLRIPYSREEITDAMHATIAANDMRDAYIRLVVTRGAGTLGLNPFQCPNPSVIIICGTIQLFPAEMYDHGMPVIIAQTRRTSASMLDPSVKSLNYLNNIQAKIEAVDANVSEALMLNAQGNIAEGTGDNVFIVSGGKVLTPPPSAGILIGITRQTVIDLCLSLDIPIEERDITPDDLFAADECFLTGTAAEVISVGSVDGQPIGGGHAGPITRRLMNAFHQHVRKTLE
jgi:branched-chain amino acid aminotransferase